MMRGLNVRTGEAADRIVDAAFESGLIIETSGAHGEIVKVLAPLTIPDEELERGLTLLSAAVRKTFAADLVETAA